MWNFTWLQVMITINIFIILVLSFVCGFFNKDLGLRNSATTVQCRCFYVWFAYEKKIKDKKENYEQFLNMCPKIHKLFKSHEYTKTQSGICGKKCQVLHSKAFMWCRMICYILMWISLWAMAAEKNTGKGTFYEDAILLVKV